MVIKFLAMAKKEEERGFFSRLFRRRKKAEEISQNSAPEEDLVPSVYEEEVQDSESLLRYVENDTFDNVNEGNEAKFADLSEFRTLFSEMNPSVTDLDEPFSRIPNRSLDYTESIYDSANSLNSKIDLTLQPETETLNEVGPSYGNSSSKNNYEQDIAGEFTQNPNGPFANLARSSSQNSIESIYVEDLESTRPSSDSREKHPSPSKTLNLDEEEFIPLNQSIKNLDELRVDPNYNYSSIESSDDSQNNTTNPTMTPLKDSIFNFHGKGGFGSVPLSVGESDYETEFGQVDNLSIRSEESNFTTSKPPKPPKPPENSPPSQETNKPKWPFVPKFPFPEKPQSPNKITPKSMFKKAGSNPSNKTVRFSLPEEEPEVTDFTHSSKKPKRKTIPSSQTFTTDEVPESNKPAPFFETGGGNKGGGNVGNKGNNPLIQTPHQTYEPGAINPTRPAISSPPKHEFYTMSIPDRSNEGERKNIDLLIPITYPKSHSGKIHISKADFGLSGTKGYVRINDAEHLALPKGKSQSTWYANIRGCYLDGINLVSDKEDLFMANFSGCLFNNIDFSGLDAKTFKTIKFHNCQFLGNCQFPEGIEMGAVREAKNLGIVDKTGGNVQKGDGIRSSLSRLLDDYEKGARPIQETIPQSIIAPKEVRTVQSAPEVTISNQP